MMQPAEDRAREDLADASGVRSQAEQCEALGADGNSRQSQTKISRSATVSRLCSLSGIDEPMRTNLQSRNSYKHVKVTEP